MLYKHKIISKFVVVLLSIILFEFLKNFLNRVSQSCYQITFLQNVIYHRYCYQPLKSLFSIKKLSI